MTCAKNGNSEYDAAELFDNCNTRLTIKGSLVAQKVRLLRVANSLRDATATSESGASATAATANSRGAEVFEFAPELFIAPPESSSNTSVVGGGYDYFTGLPPIL